MEPKTRRAKKQVVAFFLILNVIITLSCAVAVFSIETGDLMSTYASNIFKFATGITCLLVVMQLLGNNGYEDFVRTAKEQGHLYFDMITRFFLHGSIVVMCVLNGYLLAAGVWLVYLAIFLGTAAQLEEDG
jgi:hypothetical protein